MNEQSNAFDSSIKMGMIKNEMHYIGFVWLKAISLWMNIEYDHIMDLMDLCNNEINNNNWMEKVLYLHGILFFSSTVI